MGYYRVIPWGKTHYKILNTFTQTILHTTYTHILQAELEAERLNSRGW